MMMAGWLDLLVTHEWGTVSLDLNRQGHLVDATPQAGLGELRGLWNGIAAGDLDQDGDFDGGGQKRLVEPEYKGETETRRRTRPRSTPVGRSRSLRRNGWRGTRGARTSPERQSSAEVCTDLLLSGFFLPRSRSSSILVLGSPERVSAPVGLNRPSTASLPSPTFSQHGLAVEMIAIVFGAENCNRGCSGRCPPLAGGSFTLVATQFARRLKMNGSWQRLTRSVWVSVCWSAWAAGLLLSASVQAATYPEQIIADGAIHYWRFEETSVDQPAADEVSGIPGQVNNPGVYEGGIELQQESAFPALGKAAHFDEQNGTHVFLGAPQHPGPSISIEAWVLLDGNFTVGFSPIVARWDGSYELDVNHAGQGGELDFVIRNNENAFLDPHSDGPMTTDEWHHVVGIFEGESDGGSGTGIVYLDGERQIDVELGGDLQDAGGDDGSWYIGRTRGPQSGFAWLGLIDEVAIYPYALSEEQINNHLDLAMEAVGIPGDFDLDGQLTASDIDLLSAEIRAGTNDLGFDLNGDTLVDNQDHEVWVHDLKKTWFGDANLDGFFNTSDLVGVFQLGKYELNEEAGWEAGDWNASSRFDTGDLVAAFQDGGFEMGERPAVVAVPEPSTWLLTLTLCLGCFRRWKRSPGHPRSQG